MPWVKPHIIHERSNKYKPILDFHVQPHPHLQLILERKQSWSKHGNCRIILIDHIHTHNHKSYTKALLALSADEGDLLENEWGYILNQLTNIINNLDTNDTFNATLAHFSALANHDHHHNVDVTSSFSKAVPNLSSYNIKTANNPSASPKESPVVEQKEPNSTSTQTPKIDRKQLTPKDESTQFSTHSDESNYTANIDPAFEHFTANSIFQHKAQLLNPKLIGILASVNFGVVLVHELASRVTICFLLIVVNVMFLEYWIWFQEGQALSKTRKKQKINTPSIQKKQVSPDPEKKQHVAFESTDHSQNKPTELGTELNKNLPPATFSSENSDDKVDDDMGEIPLAKEIRKETIANLRKKITPGLTLVKIGSEKHLREEKNYGEWTWVSGDTITVRDGPDYATNRKKVPSENPIYETAGVDVYSISKKVWHVGRWFDLDSLDSDNPDKQNLYDGLPRFIILNVLCPGYAASMFTPVTDGEGFMTTIFLRISETARKKVRNGEWSPGMKLLKRFVEESVVDGDMRGRFKVIARVTNIDDLNFGRVVGGLVQRYNATPFLIRDGESEIFKGLDYLEIDVDMHMFSSLTRNAFYHLKGLLKSIRAHFAFVIEGRTDEELPEQLLSITEVFNVQNLGAPGIPVDLIDQ